MSNRSLGISQVDFFVKATIERAPTWTMTRELVKNAIEAAERAIGEKLVKITSREYKGVPKLVIWNTGPGLSDQELVEVTHLSASVNKELDLDANFGVGAKVSSLASNRAGMVYRSCKDGRVSQVVLHFDEDVQNYVRYRWEVDGELLDVLNVTETVKSEGGDISFEWTEVMLLGNDLAQNTAENPIESEGKTGQDYISTSLYRRFYRVPEDVSIKIDTEFTRYGKGKGSRRFETIWDRRHKSFARYEAVRHEGAGATVHFYHDQDHPSQNSMRASASGALGSTTTTMCLVHKDEMYSVKTGVAWSAAAPAFGIPFGSRELCVHIELDDHLARPSQYRERLISRDNQADIFPEAYAHVVREVMPDWVKEVVTAASPERAADYDDLQRELQSLLDEYKMKSEGRRKSEDGRPSRLDDAGKPEGQGVAGGGGGAGTGGNRPTRRNVFEVPEGATRTDSLDVFDRAPRIVPLETEGRGPRKGSCWEGRIVRFGDRRPVRELPL
jgi:hypothetical protein